VKITNLQPISMTEWEADLADGRRVYVRYRFGRLTVEEITPGFWDAVSEPPKTYYLIDRQIGGEYDSEIDEAELIRQVARP
jgi:hypothetical protein